MINAIALDDETLALGVLENFCKRSDNIDLKKTFSNSTDARKYLSKYPVELIFLDISMPDISGFDFCKELSSEIMVVFVSAHREFALEGFDHNALDYLLKPVRFDRFLQCEKKILARSGRILSSKEEDVHIYFRADYSLKKVAIRDILFVEAMSDYLRVHVENEKPIVTRMTMKAMSEKLPSNLFLRVHRSYIVAMEKIDVVKNNGLTIGDEEIPVSKSYRDAFNDYWDVKI